MSVISKKYFGSKEFLKVYCELIKAAQQRKTIYYEDIARIMKLPTRGDHMAKEVGQILGEISECEHNQGRPLLSAIVIRKDTGMPGEGFFKLARQLNKFQGQDEQNFWKNELQAVYGTW